MGNSRKGIFLAYPFTEFYKQGRLDEVEIAMGFIVNAIQKKGIYHVKFCSIFEEERYDEQGLSLDERYEVTGKKIKECGRFVGWVPTDICSKGRENEAIGAHELGMPLHLIVRNGVDWKISHKGLVKKVGEPLIDIISYDSLKTDLCETLENYDFEKFGK